MENDSTSVQLGHETNRKPRNARSPSDSRGQALREGYVVDGSGCDCGLQRVIGTSLEASVEARQQATVQASFGENAQIVGASARRIGGGTRSRYAVLGICARWLDRTVGAGHDPATVRRGVSSRICARLLHQLGWSPQKPEGRARERNEADIDRWRRETWPRLKKEPRAAS